MTDVVPYPQNDVKLISELVNRIKQYRTNTGCDLTNEEIQRWVENMLWVEKFIERYERKHETKNRKSKQ